MTPTDQNSRPPHSSPSEPVPATFVNDAPETLGPLQARSELTWQAIVTGMILGAALSACNIYVGLKIGATFGASIMGALAGFALWSFLRFISNGGVRQWTILENNISQTACSAGASVASAGLVAPIPALAMMTGQTLEWHWLALWLLSVMLLGVAIAPLLRRQMIVHEKIRFPSGIASAEVLRELHSQGVEAIARIYALLIAGGASVLARISILAMDAHKIPNVWIPSFSISSIPARSLNITVTPSLLLPALGGLIGIRVCASMLAGAVVAWIVLPAPLLEGGYAKHEPSIALAAIPAGIVLPPEIDGNVRRDEEAGLLIWTGVMRGDQRDALLQCSEDENFREEVNKWYNASLRVGRPLADWLVWPGVSMMVVASLASLAFSWRSVVRSFRWRRTPRQGDGREDDELSGRWYYPGLACAIVLSVVLQIVLFDIPWWVALVGIGLTFFLVVVAARVVGETGISTTTAIGKITQLCFAAFGRGNPVPNLMAANVSGGAANQCSDLLDDLKCGHLLGASPRRQLIAQVCGCFAGALAGSAIYLLLIPDPQSMLGSEEWPAPSARVWRAVAELLVSGFEALPEGVGAGIVIAAIVSAVMTVVEKTAPKATRPYMPSPLSFGLAFILPPYITLSLFIGGFLAWLATLWSRSWAQRYLIIICTGLLVGESLTDVCAQIIQVIF